MTRPATVNEIKKNLPSQGDGKPRPGTRLRSVYDRFRRGEVISNCDEVMQLRDFYGMEFERIRSPRGMRLVGEWEGPYFVRLEQMLQEEAA